MLPSIYKWERDETKKQESLIEAILRKRGIYGKEDVACFLNPTKNELHSPYLLKDMEKAVDRIVKAKEKKEHVVIYGDYDVDGITSTSILYMFLKRIGYDVSYYIPNRQTEGYGLNKEALGKISEYAQLVITVDTGIAATEEAFFAKERGLDLIITDHHECQEVLPDAYCIINPKRKDSTYPFESLAGVGVTFKVLQGLAMYYHMEEAVWEYIDIVALGTIADVVPLVGENRAITSIGFERIQDTKHIGLRELLDLVMEGNKDEKITSSKVAYQVGPRINAVGRLSDAKVGVELLTTKDPQRAKALAKALDEENHKRQEMEAAIMEQAEAYIAEYVHPKDEKIIVVVGKDWHHGVIGIVASKIMTKYYRPTIVLSEEEGVLSGSARSIEGFNIFEAINSVKEYLIRFGGHEMAAGLSLETGQLQSFRQALKDYGEAFIDDEILIPSITIDLDLEAEDINLDFCDALERLEPFGAQNPTPVFSIKGRVGYAQKIGKTQKHLRMAIQQNEQQFVGIGFDKGYLADYLSIDEEVIIACEIVKNTWNNRTTVQLRIKDIQSPEEIVLKSRYYTSLYHYLKEPQQLPKNHIPLKSCQENVNNASIIQVYTEENLYKVYKSLKNDGKMINLHFKVCYNEACLKNHYPILSVNPFYKEEKALEYEWDFKTIDDHYTTYIGNLASHKEQLVKMIPSHEDCTALYKFLRNSDSRFVYVHKAITGLAGYNMTEYKLFHILEVFQELGILKYEVADEKVAYHLISSAKTKLEHSTLYQNMHKFSKSILQINPINLKEEL